MNPTLMNRTRFFCIQLIFAVICFLCLSISSHIARAADHGDAPALAGDQGADLADVYAFLDPNDNSKLVLITTVHGFIVPGEAANFAIFDPSVKFRLEIENTGDEKPDQFIDISFSQRTADPGPTGKEILQVPKPQMATVTLPKGKKFTAPVLNPSLSASAPNQAAAVTLNAGGTGVDFFAGETDDPFFFDIPAFSRFVASVRNGSPDPSQLDRGRDTFAGYNILAIALRIPVSMLKGGGNVIGVDALSQQAHVEVKNNGELHIDGDFKQMDRMGNPAVNVALIPFNRKNEYNASTTRDDAKGKFANDIIATLQALGTNAAGINTLASIAVVHGDFVRVDTSIPNSGPGGGNNAGAGFPNGRRLQDDVIDTLLNIITNGAITHGDHVDANDVPLGNTFPFLAPSQQPRSPGTIDDNTRN
jgi:Domain of unknown function (DUF4331)